MTDHDKLALLQQILSGGFDPGMDTGRNRMYTSVPDAGQMGIVRQLQQMAGPFAAQMMGYQNVQALPYVAQGSGVGEAFYMQRQVAPAWEAMRNRAAAEAARGMGHDLGTIGARMGAHRMFGMSASEFQNMASNAAGSPAGSMIAGHLLNTRAAHNILGGNPFASYEQMFGMRHLFAGGSSGRFDSPLDPRGQEFSTSVAHDFARELQDRIRVGSRTDYGFTRGFRDEHISQIGGQMFMAGSFGNLAKDLYEDSIYDGKNKDNEGHVSRYQARQARVVDRIGGAVELFEAIGDVMGSREVSELSDTLDQLSSGTWARLNPGQIESMTRSVRQMQGMAQVLNVSNEGLLRGVMGAQQTFQGSIGIGASQIAAGMTGGGLVGMTAGMELMSDVYAIAKGRNTHDPASIQRIYMQQQGIMATGMQSSAGRAATMVEYLQQQGLISGAMYEDATSALRTGTREDRRSVIDAVLASAFGSVAAGRRMLDDPVQMSLVRERLGEAGGIRARGHIREGVQAEWFERVHRQGITGLNTFSRGFERAGRLSGAMTDDDAREMYGVTEKFAESTLDPITGGSASGVIKQIYDEAIERGQSPRAAMNEVHRYIRGNQALRPHFGELRTQQDSARAKTRARKAMSSSGDAEEVQMFYDDIGSNRGLRESIDAAGDSGRLREIYAMRLTDPAKARAEMDELYSKHATPDQRAVLDVSMAQAKDVREGKLRAAAGSMTALERLERGRSSGMSSGHVQGMNRALSGALSHLQGAIGIGGEAEAKARAGLADVANNMSFMLSAEERVKLLAIAESGTAEQVATAIKEAGAIDVAMGTATAGAVGGAGWGIDRAAGMDDMSFAVTSSAQLSEVALSMGHWNATMALQSSGMRASLPQLLIGAGLGTTSLARLLGVEGDKPGKHTSRGFRRQSLALANALGLEGHADKVAGGTAAVRAGRDALFGVEAEDKSVLQNLWDDFHALSTAGAVSTEQMDKLLVGSGLQGESAVEAKKALEEAEAGARVQREAQKELADNLENLDPDQVRQFSEAARLDAARADHLEKKERDAALANVGPEGLKGLYGFDSADDLVGFWARKDTVRDDLNSLVSREAAIESLGGDDSLAWRDPEAVNRRQLDMVAAISKSDVEKMSLGAQEAYGRTAERLAKREDKQAGRKGKVSSDAQRLTGTITLVDPATNTRRQATANCELG